MNDLVWINGRILPLAEATVGVEDRGFQFADGVYEVIRLYGGRPFTLGPHLDRLARSAAGIGIDVPLAPPALRAAIQDLIARTGARDGMVYLQLTRGVAPRNHLFPRGPTWKGPTLLFYARALEPVPPVGEAPPVRLLSHPDDRWRRCWIKSIALLANVLAKNAAVDAGCDEAAFIDTDGSVTECSASNILAVVGGTLVTPAPGPKVLPGITRAVLIECARELGIGVEERPLMADHAKAADELFITSTTREISPVSEWDGQRVRGAVHGPITLRLHRALRERIDRETK